MPRAVPDGGQFHGTDAISGFLEYFPHHGLGRRLVHLGPPARQGPAMTVNGFADQQQPAVGVEHRAAHADLGGGIAAFRFEQCLDPSRVDFCMRGQDAGAQAAERDIACLVVGIFGESQPGLGGRQQLPRPKQPVRIAGQPTVSVTSAGSPIARSVPVSMRHVPEISTSEGRNRAL